MEKNRKALKIEREPSSKRCQAGRKGEMPTTEGRQVCVANNAEGVEHRLQKTTEYRISYYDANYNLLWNTVYNTAKKELRKWYIDQARIRGINIPIQELKISPFRRNRLKKNCRKD